MSTLTKEQVHERSTGRLFGLSDGVFAIAMTLLALDLQVPDLGTHPSDHTLIHALLAMGPRYLAFLLSFYVIAGYWRRHNTEMRTVHANHPALVARTIPLLLVVCALPFAAGLLGSYGGQDGIAIVIYAGVNALAVISLLLIRRESRQHRLSPDAGKSPDRLELWFELAALLLAAPSGYLFHGSGPLVMAAWLILGSSVGTLLTRRRSLPTTPIRPAA